MIEATAQFLGATFRHIYGKQCFMHTSLHVRILSVVAGLIIITTIALIYTVRQENSKSFEQIEAENVRNLLQSLVSSVQNEYASIRFFREQQLHRRKLELRNMTDIVFGMIEAENRRVVSGEISLKEAQARVIYFLRNMRYDRGTGYFWISNFSATSAKILMHPTMPALENKLLSDKPDRPGMIGNASLQRMFIRACEQADYGFVEYVWPKPTTSGEFPLVPKISYVRRFQPWSWMIGTGLYVDDIEHAVNDRLAAVIQELRQMAAGLQIDANGYIYIFSGSREMLVHPVLTRDQAVGIRNPDTGKVIMDEIVAAVNSGHQFYDYRWRKPLSPDTGYFPKRVYCRYFAPLDWYICVSYYLDEVTKPVNELNYRLLWLGIAMLMLALGAAFILAKNLSAPLRRLALAAEKVEAAGIGAATIPITGSSETRELGKVIDHMLGKIKEKEESLVASEEDLKITLESIGDAVIATDTGGRITRMNAVAEKLIGWTFETARGALFTAGVRFVDPISLGPLVNPVDAVLADGKVHQLLRQTILIGKDDSRLVIDGTCAPIRSATGSLAGVVMAFRDITERIRMEEEIHQALKMDSLGRLAGGVAHDFNNMLAGILACAELMRRKMPDNQPKMLEYVNMIISTCENSADLTGKLLAFSRKGKQISAPFNVHKAIGDAIGILKCSLDKRIVVDVRTEAVHSVCSGDPAQIQNMIINLGINAGYAMPTGGRLSIFTSNIRIGCDFALKKTFELEDGEYIQIDVRDSGSGIPPEILNRIFEPFFTTKGEGQGTGLGLAAVYGSVKEHRGAIKVSSEVNVGTLFSVYLPVCGDAPETMHLSDGGGNRELRGTILLVDDEKIIRLATGSLLEDMGYHVLLADNGAVAVDIYREHHASIDLVISDMVMPKMNGQESFYAMKAINPAVKVLLASGFSSDKDIDQMEKDGLAGIIKKPYRRDELTRLLEEII